MVALFVTVVILLVTLFAMYAWLFSFVIIVSNLMLPRDANVFFTRMHIFHTNAPNGNRFRCTACVFMCDTYILLKFRYLEHC